MVPREGSRSFIKKLLRGRELFLFLKFATTQNIKLNKWIFLIFKQNLFLQISASIFALTPPAFI